MCTGTLHLLGGSALFAGEGARFGLHTAHALKICIASEGYFRVRCEGAAWEPAVAALIAADVPHELDATDAHLHMLAVGPETSAGRRLAALASAPVTRLAHAPRPGGDPVETRRAMLAAYAPPIAARWTDPRVLTALRMIRASPGLRVPLCDIAAAVMLSPSRLVHLFREQTNLSIKRYSLWLRVVAALEAMPDGDSLTDVAYTVGFSDPAHLSRAFRQMIGLNPSALLRQTLVRRTVTETAAAFKGFR